MAEHISLLAYIVRHNPLLSLGLWLVGASVLLASHIKCKLIELGHQAVPLLPNPRDRELPGEYLEVRSQHGLSPWPVYLMWPCLGAGVVTLLIGLFA